jgi:hypothetical protein
MELGARWRGGPGWRPAEFLPHSRKGEPGVHLSERSSSGNGIPVRSPTAVPAPQRPPNAGLS